jgi:hypothetical protein
MLKGGLSWGITSPFPCGGFVSGPVCFVDVRDFGDEGVVWVGVGEHRADGEEDYIRRMKEWGVPLEIVRAGDH